MDSFPFDDDLDEDDYSICYKCGVEMDDDDTYQSDDGLTILCS